MCLLDILLGKNSLEDAAAVWVHRTPHSCMRLSKSSMNGPDTIVPGSSRSSGGSSSDADGGGGGGDVTGKKMTIPQSVRDYSCDDEVGARYYFIYYHYILPMLTGESG